MDTFKTILHPTDFSDVSQRAFQLACALANDYAARLIIMHVVPTPLILGDGAILPAYDDVEEQVSKKIHRLEVPHEQVEVVRQLEEGNPAREILRVARLAQADMIVMGTHARQGVERLLLGSVTEDVLRHANCPVLTVTTPEVETAESVKEPGEEKVLETV